MSNKKSEIVISADLNYQPSELKDLAATFENNFQVRIERYQRLTGVSLENLAPILIIAFESPITRDFLEEFGKDLYDSIKQKLMKVTKKQDNSELEFKYRHGSKKVELKVKSTNERVIASAFDQISNTLQIIEKRTETNVYFDFDSAKQQWILNDMSTRKIAFPVEGIMATTDPVIVRGKKMQFTETQLRKLASEMPGMPLLYEHGGSPVGEWREAWYENGKLMIKGVVYEPQDDRERKIVEQIRTGKLNGLSLGFSESSD
ncbi:MAG TPA: hypothetical protein VJZ32_13145 [Candidatus Bathyarchaeia archaeon]|nr:hypothetical protein [Candidatus Bathyarchaeia archaeon]